MNKIKQGLRSIKEYLNNEKRGLFLAVVAMFAVVILFTFYLKKIGVPMTSARNKYNLAVQMNLAHNYTQARQLLEESLQEWRTPEAESLFTEVGQHTQDP